MYNANDHNAQSARQAHNDLLELIGNLKSNPDAPVTHQELAKALDLICALFTVSLE